MEIDYRSLLLNFISSLCYCDHMGHVSNDLLTVFNRMGDDIKPPDEVLEANGFDALGGWLEQQGFKGLYHQRIVSRRLWRGDN